jgi:hypothetical protein
VLVFAADLEEVEEVGGRGVDGDKVFGGFGGGGGEVEDFEVFGALGTVSLVEVGCQGVKYTFTYSLISMPFILMCMSMEMSDEYDEIECVARCMR